MAVTFQVSDVRVARQPAKRLPWREAVASLLHHKVEGMGLTREDLVRCDDRHPFAMAAHDAFYDHRPLVISPDDVWFCIAQGFAHHVNLNVGSLRRRFVAHEGKEKLTLLKPDFELGQENPWPEAFAEFSVQIGEHVGHELHEALTADFSTTTSIHRAAAQVTMMDAFQGYFEYEVLAGCGIPEITLAGAPDDWRDLRRRAEGLSRFGLGEWTSAMLPVLDQVEATSRGRVDREFWRSFFRYRSGSGPSELTGWLQVFFPYLKDLGDPGKLRPNTYLSGWRRAHETAVERDGDQKRRRLLDPAEGPSIGLLPSGMSSAPVKFRHVLTGEETDLRFIAGMFGVAQDATTGALSASFGWAVTHAAQLPARRRPGTFAVGTDPASEA